MKISEILKQQGMFSKDIRQRLQSGQIKLNGETIKHDLDIEFQGEVQDIGDFVFELCKNETWALRLQFFGLDNLMRGTNCQDALTQHLTKFKVLRTSKKHAFVVTSANEAKT